MNCPSSCEFKNGHIRYSVKAEVVRSMAFDVDKKFNILVIQALDLNFVQPPVNFPIKRATSKTFFCGMGSAMFVSVDVPKSGYAIGEVLQFPVTIKNTSSVDVKAIKVSLKQHVKFVGRHTGWLSGSDTRTIGKCNRPAFRLFSGVPSKETKIVECAIPIPHLPPTNVNSCPIISVTYELSVCAKVGALHYSPTLRFPIMIGTTPLGQAQIQQPDFYPKNPAPISAPHNPQFAYAPSVPYNPQFADVPSAPFSNAPPSFEVAVAMEKMDTGFQVEQKSHLLMQNNAEQPRTSPIGWQI
jgi:hypothetical protein